MCASVSFAFACRGSTLCDEYLQPLSFEERFRSVVLQKSREEGDETWEILRRDNVHWLSMRYPLANTSYVHLDVIGQPRSNFTARPCPRRSAEVDAYAGKAFRPESCGVFASQFRVPKKRRPVI